PRPRPSPVAPRIVRSERGLARRQRGSPPARHRSAGVSASGLTAATPSRPAHRATIFRRDAPAIFVILAGNWSTEIQIPGDPKQLRDVAVRRSRYPHRPAFWPFEDPEFLEPTGLIRFGLKRNTPGK